MSSGHETGTPHSYSARAEFVAASDWQAFIVDYIDTSFNFINAPDVLNKGHQTLKTVNTGDVLNYSGGYANAIAARAAPQSILDTRFANLTSGPGALFIATANQVDGQEVFFKNEGASDVSLDADTSGGIYMLAGEVWIAEWNDVANGWIIKMQII